MPESKVLGGNSVLLVLFFSFVGVCFLVFVPLFFPPAALATPSGRCPRKDRDKVLCVTTQPSKGYKVPMVSPRVITYALLNKEREQPPNKDRDKALCVTTPLSYAANAAGYKVPMVLPGVVPCALLNNKEEGQPPTLNKRPSGLANKVSHVIGLANEGTSSTFIDEEGFPPPGQEGCQSFTFFDPKGLESEFSLKGVSPPFFPPPSLTRVYQSLSMKSKVDFLPRNTIDVPLSQQSKPLKSKKRPSPGVEMLSPKVYSLVGDKSAEAAAELFFSLIENLKKAD